VIPRRKRGRQSEEAQRQFEARKVEANAIVVAPEMGRKLCEETIGKYIDADDLTEHHRVITELQQEVQEHVLRLMSDKEK
jgi:hypothetical protein